MRSKTFFAAFKSVLDLVLGPLCILLCSSFLVISYLPFALINIEMQSDLLGKAQLFWRDAELPFAEDRSLAETVQPGANSLTFLMPSKAEVNLRFDPLNKAANFKINKIQLFDGMQFGEWQGPELSKLLSAQHNLEKIAVNKEGIVASSNSSDPILELSTLSSVKIPRFWLIGLLLLALIYSLIFRNSLREIFARSARIAVRIQQWLLNLPGSRYFEHCLSEMHLIHFDKRVFLLAVLSLLFSLTYLGLGLHGSSIGVWNIVVPQASEQEGIIIGKARGIRSDEWLVQTPGFLSQAHVEEPFQLSNSSLGSGNAPLVRGMPVWHLISLFRPQHWGFFIFSPETGLSLYWLAKTLGPLIGLFLVLMLFTRNQILISAFGALWFEYSSFTQWWFSICYPELVTAMLFLFLSGIYLLFSVKTVPLILAALTFVFALVNLVAFLYPPAQITLGYLGLVLGISYLFSGPAYALIKERLKLRIFLGSLALAIGAFVIFIFVRDISATAEIVQATVYPGRRVSHSGEFSFLHYFNGYFDIFFTDGHLPARFLNASEASNFLMFWPLVSLLLILLAIKERGLSSAKSIPLVLISLLFSLWMLAPLPDIFAKLSLFSRVPASRTLLAAGLANIILVCFFLSDSAQRTYPKIREVWIAVLVWSAFIVFYSYRLYISTDLFFENWQIVSGTLAALCLGYALIFRLTRIFILGVLCLTFIANFLVNPIAQGLSPFKAKDLYLELLPLKQQEPRPNFIIFGQWMVGEYIKSMGLPVANGVQFPPQIERMSKFDRSGQFADVYNRYAHVNFRAGHNAEPLWEQQGHEIYYVTLDPCSPLFSDLHLSYAIFVDDPADKDFECLELINPSAINLRFWLYRYRAQDK